MKKQTVLVLIAGIGGHQAQMNRLLDKMQMENSLPDLKIIYLTEKGGKLRKEVYETYELPDLRNKHSYLKSLIFGPSALFTHLFLSYKLLRKYKIKNCISTGPGIAIVPILLFKMVGVKVIFLETWSRFERLSATGKIMNRIADIFIVQNKELLNKSSKAIYGGRL